MNGDCRAPGTQRLVQDEAAIGLDRPAIEHRRAAERRNFKRQIDTLEERLEIEFHRTVDDQTQRALGAVLGQEDHRTTKVGVGHAGHGQQEMIGQIGCRVDVTHQSIVKA